MDPFFLVMEVLNAVDELQMTILRTPASSRWRLVLALVMVLVLALVPVLALILI